MGSSIVLWVEKTQSLKFIVQLIPRLVQKGAAVIKTFTNNLCEPAVVVRDLEEGSSRNGPCIRGGEGVENTAGCRKIIHMVAML